ncbi:MAG TPA: DUF2490 domain-containing protein [Vicinamibacterales bacterium]|nr:DUF2490 domain-containing protein [Vicinamibacterales bacterium]
MMKRGLRPLVASAFLLLALAARASAQIPTMTDERVWFTFSAQGPLWNKSSPWRLTFESFVRSRDGVNQLDSASVRPILSYTLNRHSSIGGGLAFAPTFPVVGGSLMEYRWFEQYVFTAAVGGGTFSWRTRLEQRFIARNDGVDHRLREQVRYTHPIAPGSRTSLIGYDELFVHVNETRRYPEGGVDQNRLFAGAGRTINSRVRIEVGYLNQFTPGHALPDRMNHILSGSLLISY